MGYFCFCRCQNQHQYQQEQHWPFDVHLRRGLYLVEVERHLPWDRAVEPGLGERRPPLLELAVGAAAVALAHTGHAGVDGLYTGKQVEFWFGKTVFLGEFGCYPRRQSYFFPKNLNYSPSIILVKWKSVRKFSLLKWRLFSPFLCSRACRRQKGKVGVGSS